MPARLSLPTQVCFVLIVTALSVFAAFPALVSVGALSNLWLDYKDSQDSAYIFVGGTAAVIAALPLAVVLVMLWRAPRALAAVSIIVAAFGVAGFVWWMTVDSERRAQQHIEERRSAPSVQPTSGAGMPIPLATVSIGGPTR